MYCRRFLCIVTLFIFSTNVVVANTLVPFKLEITNLDAPPVPTSVTSVHKGSGSGSGRNTFTLVENLSQVTSFPFTGVYNPIIMVDIIDDGVNIQENVIVKPTVPPIDQEESEVIDTDDGIIEEVFINNIVDEPVEEDGNMEKIILFTLVFSVIIGLIYLVFIRL